MGNAESVGARAVVSLSLGELEDRIKRAKITGALDLSHKGIATFPQEILQLKGKITALNCNFNAISRIPDGLAASMVTLTRIELQSNWLTNFPPDFGQLINLEILDLSYNLFTALPDSLGEFSRLKELDFGWNRIQYLPASLLPKLSSLKKLNLQGNFLTALPQEIGHLSLLTSLNLRNNRLQVLPREIGKMKQLTDINLIENQLTFLPPEFGELKDLLRLLVFDNKIDTLPLELGKLPALANVDLSNNRLDNLLSSPVNEGNTNAAIVEDVNGSGSDVRRRKKKKKSKKSKAKAENGPEDIANTAAAPNGVQEGTVTNDGASKKKKKKKMKETSRRQRAPEGECTSPQVPTLRETPLESKEEKSKEPNTTEEAENKQEAEAEEEERGEENASQEIEVNEDESSSPVDIERELDRERARQQLEEDEKDEPVKWKRVQRLHMSNNLLTEVPMSIAKAMKSIKVLCLQHNSIQHIPRELGLLKYLETIDLSYNDLEDLPVELSQLPLKILYISNNRLKYSETLERLCGGLLSLQELHLGGNQLKQIPESLARLEFLTYINVYQNFISVLPDAYEGLPSFCEARPEIGSSSRQLILSYNRFEEFPPQLLKLRCLHELHFSGNAIPEVPEDIKNLSRLMLLSLGNNRVPLTLPESLGELSSLERLYLRGTSVNSVPFSLRKLIPRLIEIDISPDTVLPASTESGSDVVQTNPRATTEDKGEADSASVGSSEGGAEQKETDGAGKNQGSSEDEAPPTETSGKNKAEEEENKGDSEAKPTDNGTDSSSGGGQEEDRKSEKQRKKELKEKEKEEKKAKKAKKEKGKGGRFLKRLKGGADDKKGKDPVDSERKGDGVKRPKRPKLPKDWPIFITPYEEGTPSKRFTFGCAKMVGLGRKNEDTLMIKGSLTGKDDHDYFAVFDGHGGKHASRFAADNLHIILGEQLVLNPSDPEGALRRAFAEVNQRMLVHFQKGALREECGCTAIVALISGSMLYVAGAGDSRAVYSCGNQVQRVSLDHKPYLEEETRRVRSVGGLVKVDSDYAKQYRVCKLFAGGGFGGLAVSRALGDFSWTPQVVEEPTIMSLPLPTKGQAGTPAPSLSPATLRFSRIKQRESDNDLHAYLILGCDGVWDVLSDEEAAMIAQKEKNPLAAAVRIREHAYYLGSGDDICAVVVRLL